MKVDGAVYKYKEYRLYDVSDQQARSSSGSYMTGQGRPASAEADQKAVFDGIAVSNTYEVTEDAKDNYTSEQTTVDGDISENGGQASFVNNYEPEQGLTVKEDGDGQRRAGGDAFEFTVKVGGSALQTRTHKLYEGGIEQIGVYQTDGEGKLALKANQEAVFTGITVGTPYEVTETPRRTTRRRIRRAAQPLGQYNRRAALRLRLPTVTRPKRSLTVKKRS